jgi:hypothetical protein
VHAATSNGAAVRLRSSLDVLVSIVASRVTG